MAPYQLGLNRAALLFFQDEPLSEFSEPCVVQVIVRQSREFGLRDIDIFLRAQQDITAAVEKIVLAHIATPFTSKTIIVDAEGFSLYGERKAWDYGKSLQLTWGDQDVRACEEKWVFVFDPCPVKSS